MTLPLRRTLMVLVVAVVAVAVPAAVTGAQSSGSGAVQVPINVIHGSNNQTLVEVNVMVKGNSLPFVVDTGAANSLISLNVAKQLQLPKAGKLQRGFAAGCTPKSQPVTMSGWTLGGVALPTIQKMSATKAGLRAVGAVGLLGSDVLSSFDKVSIDYAHKVMTLRA